MIRGSEQTHGYYGNLLVSPGLLQRRNASHRAKFEIDFHKQNLSHPALGFMTSLSMFRPFRFVPRHLRCYRYYSNTEALDRWVSSSKKLVVLSDSFHVEHLSDLYITLPTRDGTRKPYQPPIASSPLGYGHHLAFFHERVSESQLREDGTEDTFSPPKPFTRRMWVGGKMFWHNSNPLIIGRKATAASTLATIEKKGFTDSSKAPMIFVTQKMDYTMEGEKSPSVTEERAHVYLSSNADVNKGVRIGVIFHDFMSFVP